jgi:hypothetical protein
MEHEFRVAHTSPAVRRTAHTSGSRAGVPPAAAAVLGLQRQAGNRAVAGLLGTRTAQRQAPTGAPGSPPTIDTAWYVEYSEVPQGGKAAPRPRTEDPRRGRRDRLVVEELQVGPGTGHPLVGGNYSPSGRSRLGRYAHPGEHGQVAGRVSYHQAKDIKITVEVPAIAHMEGSPAPTPRQRDQLEQAVRDAAVASVHRQWDEHEGEEAAIEARAAQDAKAVLPPGVSGMVRVTLSVNPTVRKHPLPSVDYHLGGPSDCYVEVDVPTKDFACRAKTEQTQGSGVAGGQVGTTSTETETGVTVGGTSTAGSSQNTATDVKLKASQERYTRILADYEKSVSTSFRRDFTKVWQDIATSWEAGSGISSETSTERDFTVSTPGPEAEERLKKQSEDEKDPSLWKRAKRAVKGFVTDKLKSWVTDKASDILGKNIVFRLLPGAARKWVARELTGLGWKAGEWLWNKITGKAKADHKPERDVTLTKDDQKQPVERQREVVRGLLQNYAYTTSEFHQQAGRITTHFQSDVHEAVRRSLEVEFGHSSSVNVHSTTGTQQGGSSTVSGSAGTSTKTRKDDVTVTGGHAGSTETRVYETDCVRVEGGEPVIRLTVPPM